MRLISYRRRTPSINLSALVDVLFILFVFVVLAAEFDRTGAVDVSLPGAAEAGAITGEEVRLVVPAEGPMRLADREVSPGQLEARLTEARGGRARLLVVADGRVPLSRATEIIAAGTAAGFDEVSIVAEVEDE